MKLGLFNSENILSPCVQSDVLPQKDHYNETWSAHVAEYYIYMHDHIQIIVRHCIAFLYKYKLINSVFHDVIQYSHIILKDDCRFVIEFVNDPTSESDALLSIEFNIPLKEIDRYQFRIAHTLIQYFNSNTSKFI